METTRTEDLIDCLCCGLENQPQANTKDPMGLAQKRKICPKCLKHASTQDLEKRNRDHLLMWRENLLLRLQEQKDAFEIQKNALITLNRKMESELESRPTQTIVENLDQEIVDKALAEKDEAWRYRDLAFGIISTVRQQHRSDSKGICHCSLGLEKCATHKIFVDDPNGMEKALLKWESDKKSQYDSGNSYYFGGVIPSAHPMITNPKWVPASFKD